MSKSIMEITINQNGEMKELEKALMDVNLKARELQNELRAVERALKFSPGNTEIAAQKQQVLAEQVEITTEKLRRLNEVQTDIDKQFAEGKINDEQYRAFQREVIETESKLKQFEEQLVSSQSKLIAFSETTAGAGEKFMNAGANVTSAGELLTSKVTAPLLEIGATAAKVGSNFESSMSKMQSVTGASGEELVQLTEKVHEMGATTQFSATEAAEALSYMAMNGWNTSDMLLGIESVLTLASATGENFAHTADIISDNLTAFGLKTADSAQFADVLAAASLNANSNILTFGESLKYVAPLAGSMGYSAEDISIALGLMTKSGIDATQAGSTLNTMISNMSRPTDAMANSMKELGISLTDSSGKVKPFETVLDELRASFGSLTETQQDQYAATLFGEEAMAGALAIINASEEDYYNLANAINDAEGSAQKMASTMTDNLQGRVSDVQGALELAAISIYENLQPALGKIVDFIKSLVDWFNNLSPAAQNTIVIMAGIATAIGPILVNIGTLISAIGAVFAAFTTVSGAIAVVTTGAAAATPAIGALAAVFSALTGPIGIAVAAIAALTIGGIALYDHLKEDAIPQIDRFGEGVSEATQQALGGFFDLSDGASQSLADMSMRGAEVTDEMASEMIAKYDEMNSQIVQGLEDNHQQRMDSMKNFFLNSSVLTDDEEAAILQKQQNAHDLQILSQESKNKRIQEIMQQAAKENRELTQAEADEINNINKSMNENAVQALSASEVEQKIIMERLKETAGDLSARQAAEVVQNSAKQRDGAVKEANAQFDETLAHIIRMRDETGDISAETADKLIAEAKKQRDESVKHAINMHAEVVDQAQKQAGDHINKVDWETGEILSKWDVFKNKTKEIFTTIGSSIKEIWDTVWNWTKEKVESIVTAAISGFVSLVVGIKDKMTEVVETVTSFWGNAQEFLTNINLLQIGKDIIQGLINGISQMADKVSEKVKGLADSIPDWIKRVLGIHSPSRVMMKLGEEIGKGLAVGIETTDKQVLRATDSIAATVEDGFTMAMQKIANQAEQVADRTKYAAEKIQNSYSNLTSGPNVLIRAVTELENNASKLSIQNVGKENMYGMYDGLDTVRGLLISQAQSIAEEVSFTISKALQIKSPFHVNKKIGEQLGAGTKAGIESMLNDIKRVSGRMGNLVVPTLPNFYSSTFGNSIRSATISNNVHPAPVINQQVVINSPEPTSPSDNARYLRRTAQELGLAFSLGVR
ncbi:phage tail tape measure protein [Sporosarcina sp. Te-1]|uniref:phage tail tape measure protein n=1 Tax=Sporosarcina sp. Te-1 TaxID=2818390 RepID=UPI001A9DB965|nr:phage tail tape measure protein [Sporosarcina sp. Te-1]QTD41537.1 phage tail tape measure protein [Sporosarcina sp. Te-1]